MYIYFISRKHTNKFIFFINQSSLEKRVLFAVFFFAANEYILRNNDTMRRTNKRKPIEFDPIALLRNKNAKWISVTLCANFNIRKDYTQSGINIQEIWGRGSRSILHKDMQMFTEKRSDPQRVACEALEPSLMCYYTPSKNVGTKRESEGGGRGGGRTRETLPWKWENK